MAPNKTARVMQTAEMTEEERRAPGASWEATVTEGMKETEKQMIFQWIFIVIVGIAVYGPSYRQYVPLISVFMERIACGIDSPAARRDHPHRTVVLAKTDAYDGEDEKKPKEQG
ncbi:hypothetical protein VPNG_08902 [Cytospora leucostoma]|uniref:Uncharacterized protein n=1 Tax=Cytospora leucostoma TaxID=1230097 RepID=A0A423VWX7_9PEZI|nr:hypothetical protein VPNG_08902 [Cytospora leucostoma]